MQALQVLAFGLIKTAQFVDPALGFSLGYTYWFKYIITTPNQ